MDLTRPTTIKKACDAVFAGEVGPDSFRSWAKTAVEPQKLKWGPDHSADPQSTKEASHG